jgi:hypothetical protein
MSKWDCKRFPRTRSYNHIHHIQLHFFISFGINSSSSSLNFGSFPSFPTLLFSRIAVSAHFIACFFQIFIELSLRTLSFSSKKMFIFKSIPQLKKLWFFSPQKLISAFMKRIHRTYFFFSLYSFLKQKNKNKRMRREIFWIFPKIFILFHFAFFDIHRKKLFLKDISSNLHRK